MTKFQEFMLFLCTLALILLCIDAIVGLHAIYHELLVTCQHSGAKGC